MKGCKEPQGAKVLVPYFFAVMGRIIGLTYDVKTDWKLGPNDPEDLNAEFDKPQTIDRIEAALKSGGHTVKRIGNCKKLMALLPDLGVDIVFNICEGYHGRNRESQVPILLEMHNIPFVGSDALSLGITLDKVMAKKCFIADGISTPKYFVATPDDDLKTLGASVGYPLLVKTRFEGTSKGLSDQSKVHNLEELKRQVAYISSHYKQTALVEQFIKGTEFTVGVIGNKNPEALPVVQVSMDGTVDLGDKFFTYARVLSTRGDLKYVCPANIPEKLARAMQDMAVKAYQSVDGRDFGRVDFRVDQDGMPYVLEINPLPSLSEEDVFNIVPKFMGTTFNALLNKILSFALQRYGMSTEPTASSSKSAQLKETAQR